MSSAQVSFDRTGISFTTAAGTADISISAPRTAGPFPDAISPTLEIRFARMGYLGSVRFSVAYMRHNDQWNGIYQSLSLDECLSAIRDEPHFLP
jgi:hypothetical protein